VFENELIDASDQEILQVARNLGMDVRTKTLAAFAGVGRAPVRDELEFLSIKRDWRPFLPPWLNQNACMIDFRQSTLRKQSA
jgi:hypothetical protein